jgi:RNA polymerase subunit RPABC4/transcription elongation factor Spt4
MRLCTNCFQITTGDPLFCNRCGFTYNRKLCPSRHINPRAAQVCAQCGSRDLSTPQPKLPLIVRPAVMLLGVGPGWLLLIALVVWSGFYVHRLITDPNGLLPLLCIALVLGILLYLWMLLPNFVRNSIGKAFKGKDKDKSNRH